MSSRLPRTIGATSSSTGPSSGRAAAEQLARRPRAPRRRRARPSRTSPRSVLCAIASPHSLSDDRVARRSSAAITAPACVGCGALVEHRHAVAREQLLRRGFGEGGHDGRGYRWVGPGVVIDEHSGTELSGAEAGDGAACVELHAGRPRDLPAVAFGVGEVAGPAAPVAVDGFQRSAVAPAASAAAYAASTSSRVSQLHDKRHAPPIGRTARLHRVRLPRRAGRDGQSASTTPPSRNDVNSPSMSDADRPSRARRRSRAGLRDVARADRDEASSAGRDGHTACSRSRQYSSRSTRFSSLPESVRGSASRTSYARGLLVAREARLRERAQLVEVDGLARLRLHDRVHALAPLVVGDAEHRGVEHLRVRVRARPRSRRDRCSRRPR